MPSGRQIGDANLATFQAWIASKTDDEYRALVTRGVLSRKEIAAECLFAKSVLHQNPQIQRHLRELEEALRARGVLPPLAKRSAESANALPLRESHGRGAFFEERLRRLEQENAAQKAEISELKRQLERYAVLREALATSGRVPR